VNEGEDGRKRKAPYSACDKCKKRKVSTVSVSRVCDDQIVDLFGLSNCPFVDTGMPYTMNVLDKQSIDHNGQD